MKRKIFLTLVFSLLFVHPIFSKVQTSNVNSAGLNLQKVEVNLDESVKLKVVKGNDKLIGAEPFSKIVSRSSAIAAINGNFFDAYKSFEPMATIIKDGKVQQMIGNTASLMVFEDNKAVIREVSLKLAGTLDNKTKNEWNQETQKMEFNTFTIWYVNTPPVDRAGIYKYDAIRNRDIVLKGGHVIEVVNDKVSKKYTPNGKISIPKDGYVIYFAPDAATKEYIDERFMPGRVVGLKLVDQKDSYTFKYKNRDISYDSVTQMIAAGPMVVENGLNVGLERSKAYKEKKIYAQKTQRSAIGLTKDDRLIMVSTSANMNQLGEAMKALGCIDAMNLDGGASSALFANGKVIKSPGRNLNTVFVVQKK